MRADCLCFFVLRISLRPRVKIRFVDSKSAETPAQVVCATDRSKAVVLV